MEKHTKTLTFSKIKNSNNNNFNVIKLAGLFCPFIISAFLKYLEMLPDLMKIFRDKQGIL